MKNVYVLGISAYYHDSAAVLLKNGEIMAAAQEERFTRVKHDDSFPNSAIEYCLEETGIEMVDIEYVAFYEKPLLKFERLLETYLSYAPLGIRSFLKAMPVWIRSKAWIKDLIRKELQYEGQIIFPEHHFSHAASAFYPSPYKDAAFLTLDGVGEWVTTSFGIGEGNKVSIIGDMNFPHSLGLLYSAFTYYCGFKVNSGEYKLMGLAPYGAPVYVDVIKNNIVDIKEDGSFHLNMDYFNYPVGLTMTNRAFETLFKSPARKSNEEISALYLNIARSIQKVTEEIVMKMSKHVYEVTGKQNLCLAGGVALNCVANGKLLKNGPFKNIWIQPAAGDAGGALGAAYAVWYSYLGNERNNSGYLDEMKGAYLGPSFENEEILTFLENENASYDYYDTEFLCNEVADLIATGNIIGWFQGRMEFGPRALGNRSILGDARRSEMQKNMNEKIKFRESFRPFAPAVLASDATEYFESVNSSPYMLLTTMVVSNQLLEMSDEDKKQKGLDQRFAKRSKLPAITHVDNSARLQTVDEYSNAIFYKLLKSFKALHGSAVLINTSFNVRGEPIVCTPYDAYQCFLRTNMDYLVLGNYLLAKDDQPVEKIEALHEKVSEFKLD